MYKNLLKDKDVAFIVDEVLSQGSRGADLVVTWYKQTDNGRYITIGVTGEFHVPKDQIMYYLEI